MEIIQNRIVPIDHLNYFKLKLLLNCIAAVDNVVHICHTRIPANLNNSSRIKIGVLQSQLFQKTDSSKFSCTLKLELQCAVKCAW